MITSTDPWSPPVFDVLVMGEILLELATDVPFGHGVPAQLGISGDALNVAASAAAAGARVGLLAVLTDDDLGRAIARRVAELGVSTDLLKFRSGQQGVYLVHCDPDGQREFSYARGGSVGSTLGPDDVDPAVFSSAGAVVAGGIACAISARARAAVVKASRLSRRFVYDPNFRSRLTTAPEASAALEELAQHAFLVTPSFPGETSALLGCSSAAEAAVKLRSLGAANVAVTCGADGIQLMSDALEGETDSSWIDAIPAPAVVDQTGAGDAFVGTMTARLVLGDKLGQAARYGAAAASLVVGGRGGTGLIPTFDQTRAHARGAHPHTAHPHTAHPHTAHRAQGRPAITRLSNSSLTASGKLPALSRDKLRTGIVHLGLGAFARAHTAIFTENAMLANGDTHWGIVGVTQRSDTVARQLAPQDGLFTVSERGKGAAPLRVVSSITEAISGADHPDSVLERISSSDTAIVTLTITEKGYRIDPRTGGLDTSDAQIQADLSGQPPKTAIGQLARGLQRRSTRDAGPITVVSCDNLPGNGELTRRLVLDFAGALPGEEAGPLTRWVEANVAFPSTMVDRMVPATTPADLDGVERELGLRDEGAVVAEPFLQWVIEDRFASRRPRWEDAGAVLTQDVAPWEAAKLRLLNASHSLLAYLGLASGKETIADAVAEEAFRAACRGLMLEDVLPVISLPRELDGQAYCASILDRFANPALGHTAAKVGSDGSQKIGLRLLTTIRDNLDAGREPRWAALAVAAWMHHVASTPVGGLDDPLAAELHAALPPTGAGATDTRATGAPATRTAATVVPALLGCRSVFDEQLAAHEGFTALLTHWYQVIDTHGLDGLRNEINHG